VEYRLELVKSSGGNHGLFVAFVTLHVVSAILGSGAIALSGVYGGTARHLERAGSSEEARRWFAKPNVGAFAVLAVPFLGLGALISGGRSSELDHAWVIGAFVIWLAIAGLFTGVVRPGERLLGELLVSPDIDGPQVSMVARRLSRAAAGCDIGFVVALGLMVWQP
jgi:hypothetical protein